MGTKINAQQNPRSDYVQAISFLGESFMYQQFRPYMWWAPLFKLFDYGKMYYKSLEVLHSFTRTVIHERKREMAEKLNAEKSRIENNDFSTDDETFGKFTKVC